MNNQNIVRLDEKSRELIEEISKLYERLLEYPEMNINIKDIINASLNTQKEKLEWRWINGYFPQQKNIFLLTDETKNMLEELHSIQLRYAWRKFNTNEFVPCREALVRKAIEKQLKKWRKIKEETIAQMKKENEDDRRA